jgi:predicted murein hydrolase (TIGR00659 family)
VTAMDQLWQELWGTPLTGIATTLVAYELGCIAHRRTGSCALVNPVLIAIVLLVCFLGFTKVPYEAYFESARTIHFLLGPATVALAIPLYRNFRHIRQSALAIIVSVSAGAFAAALSAITIAWLAGATNDVLRSIAPKSVTAPIAIGISEQIGGTPGLTAVLVVITGVLGAMISSRVLDALGVQCWRARGIATGVSAHGIGTARVLTQNETGGAFSSLAMGLCGFLTALFLPAIAHLIWG